MGDRRERALEVARQAGCEGVLAAHPSSVAWLTGFEAEIETGPSPFALGPLAVLRENGPPVLVVSEDDAGDAAALGCEVSSYAGFGLGPVAPVAGASRALSEAVGSLRVATEPGSLPAALASELDWVDAEAGLAQARAVKDADEVELLRAAIALCDAGQRAARTEARPGRTELELWGLVRGAIESEAAGRTPVLADLVSGPRTAEIGGPPGVRALSEGELVLCDLVPRHGGYWGDSCATVAVGEPQPAAREGHRRAREALERGVEAVRPGLRAGELDALVRDGLDYPHHSGHGLGTAWHEEPRIVPGSETVLEAGMVLALEPGFYGDSLGVRVERVVLVTADGCEVLSSHEIEL